MDISNRPGSATKVAKARRTTNACIPCRQSKIKCSGEEPCPNCQRRKVRCRFADEGHKILVSEQYLRELQRLVRNQQQQLPQQSSPATPIHTPRPQSNDNAFRRNTNINVDVSTPVDSELPQAPPIDRALNIWTSPFASPSTTIQNTHKNKRKWIWLALWSAWSFTVRLGLMMSEKLHLEVPTNLPSYHEGSTYVLEWTSCSEDVPPNISGLPSMDYALYLYDTVKFHLSPHYRIFDDEAFVSNVHDFYHGDAQRKASASRLWFVEFLIVLAFGKAFLCQSASPEEPPGARYFVRAMSLMPDHAYLWKGSWLAIEVSILTALYLYSIDQRESAHVYIGQAIRIAQLEGLHTQLPEEEIGSQALIRCRNLWWTVYILDRHFSSSLGLPMLTADSDITASINPPVSTQEDIILSLQVKLSHLMSVILATIYKTEQTQLGLFLETTRSILHTMAGHAQELENIINMNVWSSVETMSRATRHITLLYHQCVIVATRPLLLSVLKERLDKLGPGDEEWQSILALTTTLITAGIKSAIKTIQILSDEDSLLEIFLPFNLEFTFAAALHLIMADALFPRGVDDGGYTQQALRVIEEMSRRGNRVAEVRKIELAYLERLCQELALRSEQQGLQILSLVGPERLGEVETNATSPGRPEQSITTPPPRTLVDPLEETSAAPSSAVGIHAMSNIEFLDDIGISSGDFFSIVDQLDNYDIPNSLS